MELLLLLFLGCIAQLPSAYLFFKTIRENAEPRVIFQGGAKFKLSELSEAKCYARWHPYLTFEIRQGGRLVERGAAKKIQQIAIQQ